MRKCWPSVVVACICSGTAIWGDPIPDRPFVQFTRESFIAGTDEENDVRQLAITADGVWLATRAGLRFASKTMNVVGDDAIDGPAYAVHQASDGVLWVGAWNGLYRRAGEKIERAANVDGPVTTIHEHGGKLFAAGSRGCWQMMDGVWSMWPLPSAEMPRGITDIAWMGEDIYFAADSGLFVARPTPPGSGAGQPTFTIEHFVPRDASLSRSARCLGVMADQRGSTLWVGNQAGIAWWRGDGSARAMSVPDRSHEGFYVPPPTGVPRRLPCSDVRGLTFDARIARSAAWLATSRGVILLGASGESGPLTYRYFHSRRWLPDDDVREIEIGPDGRVWIATAGGVSILTLSRMTLAEKATSFERMIRDRHVRPPGLVERCQLRVAGDLATFEPTDTDNDGEYTGTYLVAEAYRYAVTKSPEARQYAKEAFEALEFLQTVTGTKGFIARTVLPADARTMADPNVSYSPIERAEMLADNPREKFVERRWRRSSDGKWLWKGDTSSDEVTGHLYALAIYFDLVADDEEKKQIAALVGRIVDFIIEGGYVFRDIDGEATLWGVWSPEKLNGDPAWANERGVNSVEIISYLLTAHHMTADAKYLAEADRLLDSEGYKENILKPRPIDVGAYTYIDDELLAMAYRGLVLYAPNDQRRELFRTSVKRWIATVERDASPCYNFLATSLMEAGALPPRHAVCVTLLRDVPMDMIHWTVDSRDREDVMLVRTPQAEALQVDRMLPPSELPVLRWDNNPYRAVGGEGGSAEMCPAFWLWGYWMGRYHGYIDEETP